MVLSPHQRPLLRTRTRKRTTGYILHTFLRTRQVDRRHLRRRLAPSDRPVRTCSRVVCRLIGPVPPRLDTPPREVPPTNANGAAPEGAAPRSLSEAKALSPTARGR